MQHETEAETVTWMSYAELGRARGTSSASAKRYANRQRWRKQPGNDGTVRVAVPPGGTIPRETVRAKVPGNGTDWSPLLIDANRRADAAVALADRLVARLEEAGARVDRAEARAQQERLAADRFRGEAEAARGEAREAQEAAEALRRAEAARKAMGRWTRLRAAWRGRF
jgi:hypothetical protein